MTVHAGPLPGIRPTPHRSLGAPGAYTGHVERLNPLAVSIDALSGPAQVVPNVAQVPGLDLEPGDAVWVMCVNGDRRQLLVFAVQAVIQHAVVHAAVTVTAAAAVT